jgi:8-oxo-dGTP pyrophosphatase MutT (NUDIX family)
MPVRKTNSRHKQKTAAAAKPVRWKKQGGGIIARTRVLDLRTIRYHHPARKTTRDFYVVHAPGWVNVVALTPDHHLVLVNQFRFGIDDFSLEIPGGVMEPGEDPVAAGLRELREETGYEGKNARLIGISHPNPAIMDNRCHFVLVEQCEKTAATDWDPDEEIERLTLPVEKVYEQIYTGKITHALVLDALLYFLPCWQKIKLSRHARRQTHR